MVTGDRPGVVAVGTQPSHRRRLAPRSTVRSRGRSPARTSARPRRRRCRGSRCPGALSPPPDPRPRSRACPALNLTRDEARERAALLSVDAYDVTLDLTTRAADVPPRPRWSASGRRRRARHASSTSSRRTVHEVVAQRRDRWTSPRWSRRDPDRSCAAWPRSNELRVVADCRVHEHRRGAAPVRRPGRRRGLPVLASSRWPTPGGCSPSSTSPTSRRRSRFTVTAPAHWQVVSNSPDAASPEPARRRRRDLALRADAAAVPYVTALVAGPYHVERGELTSRGRPDDPARRVLPRARWPSTWTPTTSSTSPGPGFAFFEQPFDLPYPFAKYDQLFVPEFNAGRDGERRRGDLPRGLRLPLQGARGDRRAARADDPARARAHVVRRPRHHALVGRPVAERVVRRVRQHPLPGRGDPLAAAPGRRSPRWRSPGPTGRTSCPPRTRSSPTSATSRTSRSTSTASPTPRAPRCSSSSSPGSARTPSSRALRSYFRDARVGQHRAARPARRAGGHQRPRPDGLVAGVAARPPGVNTLRPLIEVDADGAITAFAVLQEAPAEHPAAAPAPARHRLLRPRRTTARCAAPSRVELDVDGAAHRGAGAGRPAPRPTCCWSTTTTWPTPRSGSTSRSLATAIGAPRRLRGLAAAHAGLGRGLGHDPRRRDAGPRDFVDLVLGNIGAGDRLHRRPGPAAPAGRHAASCYVAPEHRDAVAALGRRPAAGARPAAASRAATRSCSW